MEKFTLVTEKESLAPIEGPVGLLVECAPDANWFGTSAVPINDLLGSWNVANERGFQLVDSLLRDEPEIDGVRHMYVLKNSLIAAAARAYRVLHLNNWLHEHNVRQVMFREASPLLQELAAAREITGADYQLQSPQDTRVSRLQRTKQALHRAKRQNPLELPWLVAQRAFPLASRMLQRKRGNASRGEWWFYSQFYTFTNIGLTYEKTLGRQFRFLLELRGTSDKPLLSAGRDWDDLYAYARLADRPTVKQLQSVRSLLREHLEKKRVTDDEVVLKELFLRSQELATFFDRYLELTVFQSRILQRFVLQVQPALIVVGNDGWEGCLLQLARRQGIPTVVLQHGVFGDFYQFGDHSGDVILARGKFWQEFLAEESRQRSRVLNCWRPDAQATQKRTAGKDLLYITADYHLLPYWHLRDLDDVLAICLKVAAENERKLVIRVHPRESPAFYKGVVEKLSRAMTRVPEVEYSFGGDVDPVIRNSAVALTWCSTMFLDCLRLGVPIVSYGWHHFPFKAMIEKHKVFHFANGLAHLRELLGAGLQHHLAPSEDYEQFLARTEPEELREFVENCARKGTQAAGN